MKNKDAIAVDVVFLFPEEINDICKQLNNDSNKEKYPSFENGYNPHITLGMGSILLEKIDDFKNELALIIKSIEFPEIKITDFEPQKYNCFNLEVSKELRVIHNSIVDLLLKYNAGTVSKENFFEMDEVSSLIDWVNNFQENSARDKYHPHITLGIGEKDVSLQFPIFFTPQSIGFFHLGVHGTCKKLLGNFKPE